jgi:hypothetical protein
MDRDREIMKLLLRARWLSTQQIRDRFFPGRTANAVNKRLAKLTTAGLLRVVRPHMTSQCWYRPSAAGAALLAQDASNGGTSVRYGFPRQLDHFARINDLRLWFELQEALNLRGFLAEWEYKQVGVRPTVVPDALAFLEQDGRHGVLAIEVDCGTENADVLVRKMRAYASTTARNFIVAVFMCVEGWRRLRSTITACYRAGVVGTGVECWLVDLGRLSGMSADSADIVDLGALGDDAQPPTRSLKTLLGCPVGLSRREEGNARVNAARPSTSGEVWYREYGDFNGKPM